MDQAGRAMRMSETGRFSVMLALLALLAFALREQFVLASQVDNPIRGDIREYVAYAWNLVTYGIFGGAMPPEFPTPDDYRSPGYPWLLALALKLFPQDPAWVQLGVWYPAVLQAQVILGTATAVFVAMLARHWAGPTLSTIAGVVTALWPHHVAATNAMLSEVLFGFCLMVALLAFARAWSTARILWWVLAGAAFGYAYLTNPLILFFPPFLAALAWWHGRRRHAAVLLLVFVVPVVALGARSATLEGWDRGAGYRAALNLVQGSWPNYHPAASALRSGDPVAAAIIEEINVETSVLRADVPAGLRRIGRRMARDPGFHARWYITKPWLLWGWNIRIGAGGVYFLEVRNSPLDRNPVLRAIAVTYQTLNPMLSTITLGAAIWLVLLGLRQARWMPAAALGALALYVTLVHEVLQAEPRYATAYRPMEAVLVLTAMALFIQWWRARASTTVPSGRAVSAAN